MSWWIEIVRLHFWCVLHKVKASDRMLLFWSFPGTVRLYNDSSYLYGDLFTITKDRAVTPGRHMLHVWTPQRHAANTHPVWNGKSHCYSVASMHDLSIAYKSYIWIFMFFFTELNTYMFDLLTTFSKFTGILYVSLHYKCKCNRVKANANNDNTVVLCTHTCCMAFQLLTNWP